MIYAKERLTKGGESCTLEAAHLRRFKGTGGNLDTAWPRKKRIEA